MSRGPGATERGVLAALARYGPMNATELAQDIFGLWGTLKLEPTAAQLGSVQRAIRHLAARGVIVDAVPPSCAHASLPIQGGVGIHGDGAAFLRNGHTSEASGDALERREGLLAQQPDVEPHVAAHLDLGVLQ